MSAPRTRTPRPPRDPVAPKFPAELASARPADGLADDGVFLSLEFGQDDLSGQAAEAVEFERCRFDGTRLSGLSLRRGQFSDVEFRNVDLAGSRLADSALVNAAVLQCRLTGSVWTDSGFREVLFDGCRSDLASFRFSRFRNVVFRGCNLVEANFQGADLTGARFEDCRLEGAQFSGAKMAGTRFSRCDLWGVSGVESLRGSVVSSADAQSLASLADAAIIAVELRRTRNTEVADAADQLRRVGTPLLGAVVLPRLTAPRGGEERDSQEVTVADDMTTVLEKLPPKEAEVPVAPKRIRTAAVTPAAAGTAAKVVQAPAVPKRQTRTISVTRVNADTAGENGADKRR